MTNSTALDTVNPLFEIVSLFEKQFITAQRLARDLNTNKSNSDFMRAIRTMETYEILIENQHLVEVDHGLGKKLGNANIALLIKSNSYRPILLLDDTAQKAIEHHFTETASQAVMSAKENSALARVGIDLDILSKDAHIMSLMKALSDSCKAKELATKAINKTETLEKRVDMMDGDSKYFTVIAFARIVGLHLPLNLASILGKETTAISNEKSIPLGKVPDQRFGTVHSYAKDVLEEAYKNLIAQGKIPNERFGSFGATLNLV